MTPTRRRIVQVHRRASGALAVVSLGAAGRPFVAAAAAAGDARARSFARSLVLAPSRASTHSMRASSQALGGLPQTSNETTRFAPRSTSISTSRWPTKPEPPVTTQFAGTGGCVADAALFCSAVLDGARLGAACRSGVARPRTRSRAMQPRNMRTECKGSQFKTTRHKHTTNQLPAAMPLLSGGVKCYVPPQRDQTVG